MLCKRLPTSLLVFAALLTSGCERLLVDQISRPPPANHSAPKVSSQIEQSAGIQSRLFHRSNEPTLHYRLLPPMPGSINQQPLPDHPAPSVRGSVVLLHGWSADGRSLLPWALALAEHGWQTVTVDLRNHGHSGSGPVGYGLREGEDVAALLQALEQQQQLPQPVYLFGVSYGAVTAAYTAAILNTPARAIVAMEPFDNARDGITSVIAARLNSPANNPLQRAALGFARRYYTPARVQQAIDRAGTELQLDLRRIDTATALRNANICTLLLHGERDEFFSPARIAAIAATLPLGQFVVVPGESHLTLPMRVDWLGAPLLRWLEASNASTNQHCPAFGPLPQAPPSLASTTASGRPPALH